MSKAYSNACVKMLTSQDIFFTDILYSLKIEELDCLEVNGNRVLACTDGTSIKFDTELFSKLTLFEAVFVLAHEVMHVALLHSLRRGGRNPLVWNIAADYAINGMLMGQRNMTMPKDGLYNPAYGRMSTEQIYELLMKDEKLISAIELNELADLIDYKGGDSIQELESKTKQRVADAIAKSRKMYGDQSSSLLREIANIVLNQRTPWHKVLRQFMVSKDRTQNSWSRVNNRILQTRNLICPVRHNNTLRRVVIGVDCSGSITTTQLGRMSAHISDILKQCRPKDVTILYFDAKVLAEHTLEHRSYDVTLRAIGGGGTNFRPVFERVDQHYTDADVLIMFTDLYGDFPKSTSIPCAWVTGTETVKVPFGEVIYAELDD